MSNFVKLDTGILNSSLWVERELRSVFITALVMARPYELKVSTQQIQVRSLEPTGWMVPPGWYGLVEAAGVGILRRDGIENVEEGMATLEKLCSPDPDSRSREFEGRRMARVNGGYLVLNYYSYRERDYRTDEGKASCYVYYAQVGDEVKIGMSKNPWARLADLRVSRPGIAIVATERGSFDLETQRHRQFQTDCVGGEWYRLSDALKAHIEQLHRSQASTTVATKVAKGVATGVATKRQRQRKEVVTTKETAPASGEAQSVNGEASNGQRPLSWPDEGAALWTEQVGQTSAGRVGKVLSPLVTRYGWPETKAALECYLEMNEGKTRKLEWFADDVVRWVALAKMPTVDPVTRELTEKGRMAYNS